MARHWVRGIAVAVAVASNVGGQLAGLIIDDYGDRPHGVGWDTTFVVVGLVYAVCAPIAWRIVPRPSPGWLMVGASIFWSAGSWGPIVRSVGWVWPVVSGVTDLWAVLVGILALCYPSGRLVSRFDRWIVIAALGLFTVRFVGILLVYAPAASDCGCVPNFFAVFPNADVDRVLGAAWRVIGVSLIVTVAVRLAFRWFGSTLPARRVAFIMPVALLLWAYASVQDAIGYIFGLKVPEPFEFIPPFAIALVPISFIAGVMYTRGLRSRVADLVIVARDKVDRELWEKSLAESLRDTSLRVYWWDEHSRGYETSDGEPMPHDLPATARPGRSTLAIGPEDDPIALIEHDVALSEDTRLLDAVSSALLLSVDNDRLRARLERTLQEVRESRLRIVEEGYNARRRLERDLHDGSQQLLVSLAIGLRIATSKAQAAGNAEVAEDLERSSAQLAEALRELRELARGIHPTVLTDGDLRSALSELALRSHVPVTVTVAFDERLPEVVEETIYFVVAECLTNAAKHADARNCSVTVTRSGRTVSVIVKDDGHGGAVVTPGGGLGGVRDRVEAVDGHFEMQSVAGLGTIIELTIPVSATAPVPVID
jgi:signal transduction histidine kinase